MTDYWGHPRSAAWWWWWWFMQQAKVSIWQQSMTFQRHQPHHSCTFAIITVKQPFWGARNVSLAPRRIMQSMMLHDDVPALQSSLTFQKLFVAYYRSCSEQGWGVHAERDIGDSRPPWCSRSCWWCHEARSREACFLVSGASSSDRAQRESRIMIAKTRQKTILWLLLLIRLPRIARNDMFSAPEWYVRKPRMICSIARNDMFHSPEW